jgi:hypothetical protein
MPMQDEFRPNILQNAAERLTVSKTTTKRPIAPLWRVVNEDGSAQLGLGKFL